MEYRKFTRLPLFVVVELHLADGSRHYGETADLSLDGAFVKFHPPKDIAVRQECVLDLIITTQEGWVRTELKCQIAHIRDEGVGVRFHAASIAGHEAFIKLLMEGHSDVEQLLEEMGSHPSGDFQYQDD